MTTVKIQPSTLDIDARKSAKNLNHPNALSRFVLTCTDYLKHTLADCSWLKDVGYVRGVYTSHKGSSYDVIIAGINRNCAEVVALNSKNKGYTKALPTRHISTDFSEYVYTGSQPVRELFKVSENYIDIDKFIPKES